MIRHPFLRGVAKAYGAGALAGLFTGFVISLCGLIRLPVLYGVYLIPTLTAQHLALLAMWGGLFGLCFSCATLHNQPVARGFFFGCLLAVLLLTGILPLYFRLGLFGSHLGENTWAFVVLYSWAWGISASLLHRQSQ